MSSLSMSDLLKAYGNRNQPPAYLNKETNLEGKTTLEKLDKLAYTRNSSSLYSKPSNTDIEAIGGHSKTIAICLVIVDELIHEDIWRQWIDDNNTNANDKNYQAKLFIHAKNPEKIKSEWVKSHTLKKTYRPEWNSPEVVRAMLAILSDAVKDDSCGRFVFGTETCLPMYKLQDAGKLLFKEDKSWLQARKTPESQWESAACFQSVDQSIIPQKYVWKSLPGWIMLTRKHAIEIVRLPALVNADLIAAWGPGGQWNERKGGVFAPEEVYFATNLSMLGYLRDNSGQQKLSDQVIRQRVTWAQWKRHGDANPITYSDFSFDLVKQFRLEGAIFARKFDQNSCNSQKWLNIMNKLDKKNDEEKTSTYTNEVSITNTKISNDNNIPRTHKNDENNDNSKDDNNNNDIDKDNDNDNDNANSDDGKHIHKKARTENP